MTFLQYCWITLSKRTQLTGVSTIFRSKISSSSLYIRILKFPFTNIVNNEVLQQVVLQHFVLVIWNGPILAVQLNSNVVSMTYHLALLVSNYLIRFISHVYQCSSYEGNLERVYPCMLIWP